MRHLSPEALLDIAEGARPSISVPHLSTCERCRMEMETLRQALRAVAAVDVPEPSPLFWDHLSARVRQAVGSEVVEKEVGNGSWSGGVSWRLAGAMSVVVLVLAVGLMLGSGSTATKVARQVAVPAAVADASRVIPLPDDASLSLLADLAGGLDWDGAAEAGIVSRAGAADWALAELSDVERVELRRLLSEALAASGQTL